MEPHEDDVTFMFQLGVVRDAVAAPAASLTLASLRDMAVSFIETRIPDNGLSRLGERILLFKHDYCSPNVLQLINSAADVRDETLVEIVLTANPILSEHGYEVPAPRPHALSVHSYKAPTFCDFCGEMLFGLVRQGLKCEGCGLNYHKRCAVKVPSNCACPLRRSSQPPRSPSRLSVSSATAPAAAASSPATNPDDTTGLVRKLTDLVTGRSSTAASTTDSKFNIFNK